MLPDAFKLYNLLMGSFAAVGLAYLLYGEWVVIGYRRFVVITTIGLLIFSVVSPIVEIAYPQWVHVSHGIAALFVIVGLYDPVHRNLRAGASVRELVKEPQSVRLPPNWMTPMDDDILELFHSAHLVLTPAIIAYNLDYSREEVNRRLSELEDHDVVERVDRGKYRISSRGVRYLQGRLERENADTDADDFSTGRGFFHLR